MISYHLLCTISSLLLLSPNILATTPPAERSPEETVSTYLARVRSNQDVKALVCCEFGKRDYYPLFSQATVTHIKTAYERPNYTIVSITMAYRPGIVRNAYFHLSRRDSLWTIIGFRSLVVPDAYYNAVELYNQSSPEELREMYNQRVRTYASLSTQDIEVDPGTFADYLAEARRLQLFVSQDDSIAAYFKRKEDQFTLLAASAPQKDKQRIDSLQRKLGIKSATVNNPGYDKYEIDTWGDNGSGFLFVKDGEKVPTPTLSGYILIQKITDNWYLYKET